VQADILKKFYDVPVISLAEALSKDDGTRVAFVGEVKNVSK
jgi:hypothetical protein